MNLSKISEVALAAHEERKSFLSDIGPLRSKLLSQTAQLQNLLRKVARIKLEVKYLKKEIQKNKKIISSQKEISLKSSAVLESIENFAFLGKSATPEGSEIKLIEQELEKVDFLIEEIEKILNLED